MSAVSTQMFLDFYCFFKQKQTTCKDQTINFSFIEMDYNLEFLFTYSIFSEYLNFRAKITLTV